LRKISSALRIQHTVVYEYRHVAMAARNNGNTAGSGVFYAVIIEAISRDRTSSVQFYSAKGRTCNNTIYMRYVHLTKA
jgi:hypothetical protein